MIAYRGENGVNNMYLRAMQTRLDKEIGENKQLRTALEWIAHRCPEVYKTSDDPHRAHVEAAVDAGNCARASIIGEKIPGPLPTSIEGTACANCIRGVGLEVGDTCDTTLPPGSCQEPLPGPLSRAALGGGDV